MGMDYDPLEVQKNIDHANNLRARIKQSLSKSPAHTVVNRLLDEPLPKHGARGTQRKKAASARSARMSTNRNLRARSFGRNDNYSVRDRGWPT
jgi:hypothetical protein